MIKRIHINIKKDYIKPTRFGMLYINYVNNKIKDIKIRNNNDNVELFQMFNVMNYDDGKFINEPTFIGHTDKTIYGSNKKNKTFENNQNGLYMLPVFLEKLDYHKNEGIIFKITKHNDNKIVPINIPLNSITRHMLSPSSKYFRQYSINKKGMPKLSLLPWLRLMAMDIITYPFGKPVFFNILILNIEDSQLYIMEIQHHYKKPKIIFYHISFNNFLALQHLINYKIIKVYYGLYEKYDIYINKLNKLIKFGKILHAENFLFIWKLMVEDLQNFEVTLT